MGGVVKLTHDIQDTYRRTVALLEHKRLQLELDLVNLGPRHEAGAGTCSFGIHKASDDRAIRKSNSNVNYNSKQLDDSVTKGLQKAT